MKESRGAQSQHFVIEGVVIVLSILLAFGIDALWAGYQQQLEEEEILASLESDYSANLQSVTTIIDAYEVFAGRVDVLIHMSPEDVRALSQKEVSEIMMSIANPWTFDAVRGTTDTLVYGGKLAILSDPQLRKSLVTFLNRVSDAGEDVAYVVQGAQDVWMAEIRLGGPWTDPATEVGYAGQVPVPGFVPKATPEDLLNVRADAELMGHVKRFHINAAYYVMELENMRDLIEEILALIAESS